MREHALRPGSSTGSVKVETALAARHAHVTANGRAVATVDDEVVAFGLARDRVLDRLIEALIAFREAQGRAQVGCVLLAQTLVELARTSEPHAIAGFAKVM